ncbi:MAG: S41 family peptidase, partial [Fidelibacterota bacterium]
DEIIIKDVPYYGVDEEGIGYIRITKFSRFTGRDFRKALLDIAENENLTGIVIDLRSNSGGLLNNAISILDNLVEKNTLVLKTKGRMKGANRSYFAKRNPEISRDVPIAVLINHSSASASEIVAGSLQDLDRAVIIGEKSFGKGLVQRMFSVNDSTRLKMTTAKYYTPSGRLIQKYDYLDNGVLTDGLDKKDSTFTTIGGRKVRGGGGITPDLESKRKEIPPFVKALWSQGLFLTFSASYVPTHQISEPFQVTDEIIDEFKGFLQDYHFEYLEPGEREFNKMKSIISKREGFSDQKKKKRFSALFFWKKRSSDALFNEMNKYFASKKKAPFDSSENIAAIRNGIFREISSVITGRNSDRIKASLTYDSTYELAKSVLLDANRYYTILSPEFEPIETADETEDDFSRKKK